MTRSALTIPVLLLLPVAIYSATFSNGYVWDDWTLFINSPALRTGDIWSAISQPVLDGTTYFRPIVLLTFATEFRLIGVSAFVSHLVNLLIHQANVLLVFALALNLMRRLSLSRPELRAALAAILYVVHPSLVESVAWASGRFDLLATFFTLAALVADVYVARALLRRFLIGVCFAGALGSKELGVTLPALLLIHRVLLDREHGESVWRRSSLVLRQELAAVALCGAIFILYLVLRVTSMGDLLHVDPKLTALTSNPIDRTLLVLNTFAFYFKEVLLPFGSVGPYHPLDLEALRSVVGVATALAAATILALIIFASIRGAPSALLLFAAVVALLPVSQILPIGISQNIGNDRFLALPLVFVALGVATVKAFASGIIGPRAQALVLMIVAMIWLPGAALTTRLVVSQWRSDLSLWIWAYQQHPDFEWAQLNLASSAMMSGRPEIAKVVFDRLTEGGRPLKAIHQVAYGAYLVATGGAKEGEKYIEGALLAFPPLHTMSDQERFRWRSSASLGYSMAAAYSALATAHVKRGEFEDALQDIDFALWYKPTWPTLLVQKSNILLALDKTEASKALLQSGLALSAPEKVSSETAARAAFVKMLCRDFPERNPGICAR